VFGAVSAIVVGGLLRLIGGGQGVTPVLPVAWTDLFALVPCPLVAGLVAALAARLTASALVKELA
jgi:cell division transport system permease protein